MPSARKPDALPGTTGDTCLDPMSCSDVVSLSLEAAVTMAGGNTMHKAMIKAANRHTGLLPLKGFISGLLDTLWYT